MNNIYEFVTMAMISSTFIHLMHTNPYYCRTKHIAKGFFVAMATKNL